MRVGVLCVVMALLLAGCGSSSSDCDGGACIDAGPPPGPTTDGGCTITFSGEYAETDYASNCCITEPGAGGDLNLSCVFTAQTAVVRTLLDIGLGVNPQPGDTSSSGNPNWSCGSDSLSNVGPNCGWYAAPGGTGSFSLHLSSLDAPGDGGPTIAHGTLQLSEVTASLDDGAPDGCGVGTQTVAATF